MEEKKALPDPTKPRKSYKTQKARLSDEAWLAKHLEKADPDQINKEMLRFIQAKKQDAHDGLKLYIDLDLKELKKEWKERTKQDKAHGLFKAMLYSMLIGDQFLSRKKKDLKIRYYTDNLSFDRPRLYSPKKKD